MYFNLTVPEMHVFLLHRINLVQHEVKNIEHLLIKDSIIKICDDSKVMVFAFLPSPNIETSFNNTSCIFELKRRVLN